MKNPYLIIKRGMFYADDSCGYVGRAELAGLYTEEEAKEICDHTHSECKAVKAVDLIGKDHAQHCIDKLTIIRDAERTEATK